MRRAPSAPREFLFGPERDAYDAIWPPALRRKLALMVMEQPRQLRQNLLRVVEATLTARRETVEEASLQAAFAEAVDDLTGVTRRRQLAARRAS